MQTPTHFTPLPFPRLASAEATPATPTEVATPHFVGNRNTFDTPPNRSPMASQVSQWLLESLNLMLMDDGEGDDSREESPRSTASQESAAMTVTCSTEGPQCVTP